MKRSTGPSKTTNLFDSVQRYLNMSALVLGAVGFILLALTQPAEAKIVYTPTHVEITFGDMGIHYNLDLNHDGVTDFIITGIFSRGQPPCMIEATLVELPASGNGVESSPLPAALKPGALIGHDQQFYRDQGVMAFYYNRCQRQNYHGGAWFEFDATQRYLGLSFRRSGRTHYGWARLTVQANRFHVFLAATLTGYAYETIPGKSIEAGKEKGSADVQTNDDFSPDASLTNPIPKLRNPGLLAMGAPGLSTWRREESVVSLP